MTKGLSIYLLCGRLHMRLQCHYMSPVLSNPDKSRRLDCGRWRISIKSSPIAWLPRLVGIRPKDSSADRQWVLCPYVWQKYGTLYAVSFHGCVMLLQLVG